MSNQTFASFINGDAKEDVNYKFYKFAQETDYPIDFGENANWCQQEADYESGVGVSENLEQTLQAFGAALLPSYKAIVAEANKTNEIIEIPVVISTADATYEGTVWVGNLRAKDGITADYWLDFNKLKMTEGETTKYALVEPTGKYFVNPSYQSWSFTQDKKQATTFDTFEEAEDMRKIIDRAVFATYWDYTDIEPYPKVVEV